MQSGGYPLELGPPLESKGPFIARLSNPRLSIKYVSDVPVEVLSRVLQITMLATRLVYVTLFFITTKSKIK